MHMLGSCPGADCISSLPGSAVPLVTTGQLDLRLVLAQGQDFTRTSAWCPGQGRVCVLDGCSDIGHQYGAVIQGQTLHSW